MDNPIHMQEVFFTRDGIPITGEWYTPAHGTAPYPAVILSHGFADCMDGTRAFARGLAQAGFAACIFDFIGGSLQSRSGGSMQDMSVLTEAADLDAVIRGVLEIPEADPDRLFLLGASQGGFVSTYAAARHPEVRGLVLLFPAYVLQEDARKRVSAPGYVPGECRIMGQPVGAVYDRDALSFDIFDSIRAFDRPVLLLHGTADTVVPISWSERASDTFPDARLVVIPDAGHGFTGADERTALDAVTEFLRRITENGGEDL
ncbi:MAG: alpha/beta fold hydrolase [Oscillospiraceae bacterium]|nr:alpha/beta fold hydrolase [Oscillospiraceae bacterium]